MKRFRLVRLKSPHYIGKHPGNAFMELQFYPPGYVEQFEGFGCTATQYCAAMTIDSLTLDQNHADPAGVNDNGTPNNADCKNYVLGGQEPINWAYITRSGQSQAPANPLFTGTFSNPNFAAVNPDNAKDLFMNPGDRIQIHMHDTPAGFRVDMVDLSTGQSGSMTASVANGFGHILFEPNSSTCHEAPYASQRVRRWLSVADWRQLHTWNDEPLWWELHQRVRAVAAGRAP